MKRVFRLLHGRHVENNENGVPVAYTQNETFESPLDLEKMLNRPGSKKVELVGAAAPPVEVPPPPAPEPEEDDQGIPPLAEETPPDAIPAPVPVEPTPPSEDEGEPVDEVPEGIFDDLPSEDDALGPDPEKYEPVESPLGEDDTADYLDDGVSEKDLRVFHKGGGFYYITSSDDLETPLHDGSIRGASQVREFIADWED